MVLNENDLDLDATSRCVSQTSNGYIAKELGEQIINRSKEKTTFINTLR